MKSKSGFRSVWVYAAIPVLLFSGFAGIHLYCVQFSKVLHTYTFNPGQLFIPQDQMVLSMTVSKTWQDETHHPETPCGAQYDGLLTNQSDLTFKNWSAELTFSEPVFIDSSWNGVFSASNNKVLFVAKDSLAQVKPHTAVPFGAVMYAKKLLTLKKYTISGYRIIADTDLRLFHILIILSVLWALSLSMHIIIQVRTTRYRRRQELDSAIITQSMNTFTGFIDAKDPYTKGHSVRVAEYAAEIARRMNIDREQITQIYYIALMHDCGKIGVPDAVLGKPDKLTAEEYKQIQAHTDIGDAILLNFTAILNIRNGAHFHHERYDGTGYPAGLQGEEIPLCARILCVADSFDAMSSHRCYRAPLSKEKILSELQDNAGKQFDPKIVPFMLEMIQDGFTQRIQAMYPNSAEDVTAANQKQAL